MLSSGDGCLSKLVEVRNSEPDWKRLVSLDANASLSSQSWMNKEKTWLLMYKLLLGKLLADIINPRDGG